MKPIVSLQCMRAVAAILVVCYHHINALRDRAAPGLPYFEIGQFGVDIFFVISGFIMWTTTCARPTSGVEFMSRRIVRIVPLYWIFTLATAFISTDGGLSINAAVEPLRLLKSLFFVPQWSAEYELIAPIMLVGWTLELEMLFYAIFACVLFLAPAKRVAVMCAILAALTLLGLVFHPQAAIPNAFTNSIIAEFAIGVLLGWAYEKRRLPQSTAIAAALTIAALLILPFHRELTEVRLIYFGIPAAMIVAAALMMERHVKGDAWRIPKFLGDASYSVYLSHLMAMAISWKLVPHALASAAPWPVLIFQVIFAVGFGAFVYVAVEKPVTDAARRALSPKARPAEIIKGL